MGQADFGARTMRLSGSDFYQAYLPSQRGMRLYLHHEGRMVMMFETPTRVAAG
jgi:hypothetical protein